MKLYTDVKSWIQVKLKTSRGRGVTQKMSRFIRSLKNSPFKGVKIIIKFCNNHIFPYLLQPAVIWKQPMSFMDCRLYQFTSSQEQFIGVYEKPVFSSFHGKRYQAFDSFYEILFILGCSVSINLQYGHAWNTVVMSGLVPLVATWHCQISYKNGYAELSVLHLLPLLNH